MRAIPAKSRLRFKSGPLTPAIRTFLDTLATEGKSANTIATYRSDLRVLDGYVRSRGADDTGHHPRLSQPLRVADRSVLHAPTENIIAVRR